MTWSMQIDGLPWRAVLLGTCTSDIPLTTYGVVVSLAIALMSERSWTAVPSSPRMAGMLSRIYLLTYLFRNVTFGPPMSCSLFGTHTKVLLIQ